MYEVHEVPECSREQSAYCILGGGGGGGGGGRMLLRPKISTGRNVIHLKYIKLFSTKFLGHFALHLSTYSALRFFWKLIVQVYGSSA